MGSVNEAVFGVGEGEGTRATRVEKKFSVFGSGAHLMSRPWLKYIGELIFGRLCKILLGFLFVSTLQTCRLLCATKVFTRI
jgi:hypothetical protein